MNITIGSVDVGAEIVAILACAASAAKGGGGENDHMSCRMRDAQAHFTPVLPDYAAMLAALTEMEEHVLAGLSVSGDVLARLFDAPQDQCVPAYYLYAGLQAGLDTERAIGCICRELETEDFGIAVGQETPPMDMMTFIRRARAQGLDERYIWNLTCMLSDWDAQCAYLADLIARGEALWQEKAAQLEPLLRVWLGRMDARVEAMRQTGRIAKLLKLSDREAGYRLIPSLRGLPACWSIPASSPARRLTSTTAC